MCWVIAVNWELWLFDVVFSPAIMCWVIVVGGSLLDPPSPEIGMSLLQFLVRCSEVRIKKSNHLIRWNDRVGAPLPPNSDEPLVQKVNIIYEDPDATDSSSDEESINCGPTRRVKHPSSGRTNEFY
ncbi:hypothetical protein ACFE04_030835 [Oxalis oulophora]